MRGILITTMLMAAMTATAWGQADLERKAADTTAFSFSWAVGFAGGAGEKSWHAGGALGPVYMDFNGDYKALSPPEEKILEPFSWFRHVGESKYMRKGIGLGVGVQTYDLVYLYGGIDLTWTKTYNRWASNASGEVWFTEKETAFKLGWWAKVYFHPWEAGFMFGVGYGDLRGVYGTLVIGVV